MAEVNRRGFSCLVFLIVLLSPLASANRPLKQTHKNADVHVASVSPPRPSAFGGKKCGGIRIPGVNVPGVGVNVPGVGVYVPGVGVNVPGVGVNIPGVGVNVPGVGVNIPGVTIPGVNVPGVDIPGVSIGIPGVSIGGGGVQVGVPGAGGCAPPSGCGGCQGGYIPQPRMPGWGRNELVMDRQKPNFSAEAAARGQHEKVAN